MTVLLNGEQVTVLSRHSVTKNKASTDYAKVLRPFSDAELMRLKAGNKRKCELMTVRVSKLVKQTRNGTVSLTA